MNKIQQKIKKYLPIFGQQWSKFNNYELYKLSVLNSSAQTIYDLGLEFNTKHAPTSCQQVKNLFNTTPKPISSINKGEIPGLSSWEIQLNSENKFLFALDEVESFYSKNSTPELGDIIRIEGRDNLYLILNDSELGKEFSSKYIKIANVFNHKGLSVISDINQSSGEKLKFLQVTSYKKYYLTKIVKFYVIFSLILLLDTYFSNRKNTFSILYPELHSIVNEK